MNERRRRPPIIDAEAFTPPVDTTPGRRRNTQEHAPLPGPNRSVVVKVNAELLNGLRTHCKNKRMSVTDAVLSAHLNIGKDVQQALRPTPSDQHRVALGLPQTSARDRLGPGKPLSLWLTPYALAELDAAAAAANITRRRYITALLTALLKPANTPDNTDRDNPPED